MIMNDRFLSSIIYLFKYYYLTIRKKISNDFNEGRIMYFITRRPNHMLLEDIDRTRKTR